MATVQRGQWLVRLAMGLLLAPLIARVATAQAPDARSSLVTVVVTPDTVTIGEPFKVHVRVRAPKVATVVFPEVPGPTGGVDPLDPRVIEEGPPGDLLDRTAVYSFVAWDVGAQAPALGPVMVSVAGQERSFALGATGVVVRSLLPADSTERTPRDVRGLVSLPGKLWQFIVVGVALLVLLAWLWQRRRRRLLSAVDTEPEAWTRARDSFRALETLALADAGEPGRHVIAHTDVLREYVERRYPELKASLDATTFLAAVPTVSFAVPDHRIAALVQRDASLRFAHGDIAPDEANHWSSEARDMVAQMQLAHEARQRAVERPPRPKRR